MDFHNNHVGIEHFYDAVTIGSWSDGFSETPEEVSQNWFAYLQTRVTFFDAANTAFVLRRWPDALRFAPPDGGYLYFGQSCVALDRVVQFLDAPAAYNYTHMSDAHERDDCAAGVLEQSTPESGELRQERTLHAY